MPLRLQQKQHISRINNIFDEYAGITIEDRGFQPPEGIRVFKSIGLVKADGTWEPRPALKPKAKAPPPSSPPGTDPNGTSGIISPTSPGRKEPMNWPMAKMPAGSGKGSRGNKIPTNPQDVRIGDGSVLAPAHVRSKSYRDVALASGSGSLGSGHMRALPQVNLPGQAGPGPERPIKTSVPDIKLNPNRPLDDGDNAWLPRVDGASRRIAAYMCHGSQDKR